MAGPKAAVLTLLLYNAAFRPVLAQQTYYFSGAVQVWPAGSNSGTAAVQAQCPADHPVSCSSISEPNYCCPTNNYCAWSNSIVACCPQGETCTGAVAGQGGYQPTSWYPTTTTWNTPAATTTVYAPYNAQTTTQQVGYNGQYCSTETAIGPGLPATGAGDCGTILIVAAAAEKRVPVDWLNSLLLVAGLHAVGGGILFLRH